MSDVTLLGLDLAWVERNPTGAVVVRADESGAWRADAPETLLSDQDILDWAEEHAGAHCVMGIDAPLFAPNEPKTSREADKQVTRLYGRFHAGVYPANSERCPRPIRLAQKFAALGWGLDPFALGGSANSSQRVKGRHALEVYPHAASVGLFGLSRIVKYKRGRVAVRRAGLQRLQDLIHEHLPTPGIGIRPPPRIDIAPLRGRAIKAAEDRLDALLCAAMIARFVLHPNECLLPGATDSNDFAAGYILVPKPPDTDD
jgi:predicted RNase H-like nuclease